MEIDDGTPEPRLWESRIEVGNALVWFRVHRFSPIPGKWFLTCDALQIRDHELDSKSLKEAKVEAIAWGKKQFEDFALAWNAVVAASS